MMKRMLIIVAAVMVLVPTSAMATTVGVHGQASLDLVDPLGTGTQSQVRAITNDGQYAIGFGPGGSTDRSFLWTKAGGTSGPLLAGSYMSSGTGIAYRTNPTSGAKELVIGGNLSSGDTAMFVSTNNGSTWTRYFDIAAGGASAANSVGGNGAGATDHAWLAWSTGTTSYSVTRIHGDPITNGTATKSSTQAVYTTGISNTGRAAAQRKNAGGARQNVYLDFTTDGGTAAQNIFNGLDGTTVGQPGAMSGNGAYVFGQSHITGDAVNNYPYKYTVGGGIVALPLLPGTTGSVSLGYIYGASADGRYACGMDYTGMEKAALWDTQTNTVIDLTTWAASQGILDGFTGNLRRAYTIGVDSLGRPVIGGMGVYYAPGDTVTALTRGFILTIPEPGTMVFLVVGGLALLRRRR